ncbi:MAG: hypothetical protein V2I34_03635 [Bacteroidales bacterium]|jgi:hypothetical protein|nr:hypothetical protein [Bacteroidales bacterium]
MNFRKRTACILPLHLILLLCFSTGLFAFDENDGDFIKIFDLIYNQDFEEARLELDRGKTGLDKWEYNILNIDLMWWEALTADSREAYKHFESALKSTYSDIKKSREPYSLMELITLSYSFRLEAMQGNLITMMIDFMKINHIIQRFDTGGLSPAQKELFSVYLALFNIGKSKLLFNNPGLRQEGIKILEANLSSSDTVSLTISRYFLSKIYLEVDPSPEKARIYCEQLCSAYPSNKIFTYNLELCNSRD